MHIKSIMRAAMALLAGALLFLTMTGCPNPALPTLKAKGTGSITGIVVSETGATIAGVVVTAEQTDGVKSLSTQNKLKGKTLVKSISAQTATDLKGSFTLSGLVPGIYTLNVSVPDTQAKAVAAVTVLEGQTVATGTLQVRKTGDIAGRVLLSDNADPLGIVVFIAGTSFSAMTDAAGNFRIIDVPVGTAYTLVASKMGYDSSITTLDVVVRSTTTIQQMILIPHVSPVATGAVFGTVTLEGSSDHEGIFVYLVGTSNICITNLSGEFNLEGVAPGNHILRASKEGYQAASITVTTSVGERTDAGQLTLSPARVDIVRTLTVAAATGGMTSPAGSKVVVRGVPTDILATPETGYRFMNWTVTNGVAVIGNAELPGTTVTLDSADASIQANFEAVTHTLTILLNRPVEVTVTPGSPTTVLDGVPTPISAGYPQYDRFIGWTVVQGNASFGSASSFDTNVILSHGDATIQANYMPAWYTLNAGGSGNGWYAFPYRQQFTLYADGEYDPPVIPLSIGIHVVVSPGYHFVCWYLDPMSQRAGTIEDLYSEYTHALCTGGDFYCYPLVVHD
jgi:hypothetical protein